MVMLCGDGMTPGGTGSEVLDKMPPDGDIGAWTRGRSARDDCDIWYHHSVSYNPGAYENFDITAKISTLVNGVNVLAIQGMNTNASSSDALVLPQLIAQIDSGGAGSTGYFTVATPGAPNGGTETIQLPQTVHFQQPENLAAARQQFDAHVNFTLLVRDQLSLELVRREFRARTLLCPDMAFYLGGIEREWQPDVDILWLRRDDRESAGGAVDVPSDVFVCDWLDERVPTLRRIRTLLRPLAAREPRSLNLMNRALAATYERQARQRLREGCRLLSRGKVVITDRLHAHILCLLLGIPHVLLDNSYGKVRRVHEAWTADAALVRWAASPAEAVAVARSLLTA